MKKEIAAIILLSLFFLGIGFQWGQQVHHYIEIPLVKYHREVVERFSAQEYRQNLRNFFSGNWSWIQLLYFEATMLTYSRENIKRYDDPITMIKERPIYGRCGEFAILYTALLNAFDFRARLVVDITGDHVWTELYLDNGTWMHIDPTECCSSFQNNGSITSRVNDPLMYERDWHKSIEQVAAFEGNELGKVIVSDVTYYYRSD